jgi:hypothetical protein
MDISLRASLIYLKWVTQDVALDPDLRARFLAWVVEAGAAEDWTKIALEAGRVPDAGDLVLDAAAGLQQLVGEAWQSRLDRLTAVIEARQALGEL